MNQRRVLLILLSLAVLGLSAWWRSRLPNSVTPFAENEMAPKTGEPRSVSPPPGLVQSLKPSTERRSRHEVKSEGRPLKEFSPTLREYQENVAEDPHGTPKSLRRFSSVMGEKMQLSMNSESAARAFFLELRECVSDGEVQTVRQVCLVNARRLLQKHPGLSAEAATVEEAASPELKDAVKKLMLD